MTLHSVRDRALFVAPVRILLGAAWLVAARAAGSSSAAAWLAFAGGFLAIVFALANDPRPRFRRGPEPKPAPPDAPVASPERQVVVALMPSTVGVSVLAAALELQPTLSAFLAGVCAGLGVAGALAALRVDRGLYVDPRRGALYRRAGADEAAAGERQSRRRAARSTRSR